MSDKKNKRFIGEEIKRFLSQLADYFKKNPFYQLDQAVKNKNFILDSIVINCHPMFQKLSTFHKVIFTPQNNSKHLDFHRYGTIYLNGEKQVAKKTFGEQLTKLLNTKLHQDFIQQRLDQNYFNLPMNWLQAVLQYKYPSQSAMMLPIYQIQKELDGLNFNISKTAPQILELDILYRITDLKEYDRTKEEYISKYKHSSSPLYYKASFQFDFSDTQEIYIKMSGLAYIYDKEKRELADQIKKLCDVSQLDKKSDTNTNLNGYIDSAFEFIVKVDYGKPGQSCSTTQMFKTPITDSKQPDFQKHEKTFSETSAKSAVSNNPMPSKKTNNPSQFLRVDCSQHAQDHTKKVSPSFLF